MVSLYQVSVNCNNNHKFKTLCKIIICKTNKIKLKISQQISKLIILACNHNYKIQIVLTKTYRAKEGFLTIQNH
jgi:hypothetical protein